MDAKRLWILIMNLFNMIYILQGAVGKVRPPRGKNLTDEERLMKKLFKEYNPSARPVLNSTESVTVAMQFSLMHIKELDIRSQVLTTTGLLIMQWDDERLRWSPRKHNDMSNLVLEANKLWRPEFAVINGAERIHEDFNKFRAFISSNGNVRWEPGGVFKTMCEIDIRYYPFDKQKCNLKFGAWSYTTAKMNLTNVTATINMDSYKTNGEWEISHTLVKRNEFNYACCPEDKFSNIEFKIYLRRRHTYYVMNVILPSIMTSILLLSIFFCTPGQKVQIGVVVLLSFRIFLLNVADNIPKTSDHIPILGIYLTCTMAITTLSMVLTVFVLNMNFKTGTPVPPWFRKLSLGYMAYYLSMCSCEIEVPDDMKRNKNGKNKHRTYVTAHDSVPGHGPHGDALIELNAARSPMHLPVGGAHNGIDNCDQTFINQEKELSVLDKKKLEDSWAKDWQAIAKVFDRLFFWLFLLLIVATTLILFHPLWIDVDD